MAIDTRDKRACSVHRMPWDSSYALPNNDIDQGDRQQLVKIYRGILAGAAVIVAITNQALSLIVKFIFPQSFDATDTDRRDANP